MSQFPHDPTGQMPPPPPPPGPPPKKDNKTLKIVLITLGVMLLLLLGGCTAFAVWAGSNVSDLIEDLDENSEIIRESTTVVTCEPNAAGTQLSVEVDFTNNTGRDRSIVNVNIDVLDVDGNSIGSATAGVQSPDDGETTRGIGTSTVVSDFDAIDRCEVTGGFMLG